VTRVALLRAQLDLTRAEQDLVRQSNSLAASKLALATLIVREDTDFELAPPPEPSLPAAETDLVNLALEQRADVAAAREGVRLAGLNKTGAWLAYLPTLGLSGVYRATNAAGFTGQATTWAINLAVNWTIWDGGLREINLREQSSRVRESTAQQELAVLRTREEVKRSQLDLETALGNRSRAAQALELARETQRLTEISFKAGVATYLEVADANAALTGAEVGFISERLNAALSALRLLRSVGAFGREPVVAEVTKEPLPSLTRELPPLEQPKPAQQP
jgi:outer membrane protein TolC